jgi:VWFA-related protein
MTVSSVAQDAATVSGDNILRARSQLVVLNPVVLRKDGTPVRNLPQSGFTVYENGIRQTIRNFEAPVNRQSVPAEPQKDKLGRIDWGDASETILVLDALNTPFEEVAYARGQMDRYLKAQPPQLPMPATIVWLDSRGFRSIVPLTRDRAALLKAVDSQKGSLPEALLTNDLLRQFALSLAALQQIALSGGGERGSKEIIWVGRSFPNIDLHTGTSHQIDVLHRAVQSTIDELLKARATIYVIDTTPQSDPAEIDERLRINENADLPVIVKDPFLYGFTFKSFVEQTGGRYFFGRNDISEEIRESLDRGESFYTLSYVPNIPISDGEYRKVDVRVESPQLIVQSREGYYPSAMEAAPETSGELRFDLYEATNSRMAYTGVKAVLQSCAIDTAAIQIACNALVANKSISFDVDGNGESGSVVAVLAALDEKDRSIANSVKDFKLKRTTSENQTERSATALKVSLPLKKGTRTIRLVVRDSSGRIGTAELILPAQH